MQTRYLSKIAYNAKFHTIVIKNAVIRHRNLIFISLFNEKAFPGSPGKALNVDIDL